MIAQKDPLKVPEAMQALYDEITAISNAFCEEHLNEEYRELARKMTATLARKRPSPLVSGHAVSWAAGILYTLAQVNFLFDKSQSPHIRADELCKRIGVSQQTASGRAQKIRAMLDISMMDFHWTLPSRMDKNSMAWSIMVDGLIVDARRLPREMQEIAYRKGLIPYIHADRNRKDANDVYDRIIEQHFNEMRDLYLKIADQQPILVFDIQKQTIYAYSYQKYKSSLNQENQALLEEQYQYALKNNQMAVIFRDTEQGGMALYTINLERKNG